MDFNNIMNQLEERQYSIFTQKFIEIMDEYRGIANELAEFQEEGQPVPPELQVDFQIYQKKVEDMCIEGYNRWNKGSNEMYKDGWKFWMKEDAELREKRYGNR